MYSFIFMHKGYALYLSNAIKNTNCGVVNLVTKSIIQPMKWYIKIKQLMKERKIIQDDLIGVFGVCTRGAVGHYLSGRRTPNIEQFKALADKFGLSLDELLQDDTNFKNKIVYKKPYPNADSIIENNPGYGSLTNVQTKALNDMRQLFSRDIDPMDMVTLQQIIGMLLDKYSIHKN